MLSHWWEQFMIILVRRLGKIICFFRLESYKQIPVWRKLIVPFKESVAGI